MKEIFKNKISKNFFASSLNSLYRNYFEVRRSKFGFIHNSSKVRFPSLIKGIENVYLHENTHILGYNKLITTKSKFVMKRQSGAAEGLTVVTGTHPQIVGEFFLEKAAMDEQIPRDVIVEEDVWLSSNVTLLAGVTVGRGAIVGSGAVCRNNVPPYAVVSGNPAKIVGFKFSPEEVINHEIKLYRQDDRLSLDILEKNYKRYFLDRLKEIKVLLK